MIIVVPIYPLLAKLYLHLFQQNKKNLKNLNFYSFSCHMRIWISNDFLLLEITGILFYYFIDTLFLMKNEWCHEGPTDWWIKDKPITKGKIYYIITPFTIILQLHFSYFCENFIIIDPIYSFVFSSFVPSNSPNWDNTQTYVNK